MFVGATEKLKTVNEVKRVRKLRGYSSDSSEESDAYRSVDLSSKVDSNES